MRPLLLCGGKNVTAKRVRKATSKRKRADEAKTIVAEAKKWAKEKNPHLPRNLRFITKKKMRDAWPTIIDTMVEKAEKGSVNHAKFIVDLGGIKDKPAERKQAEKSFAALLKEELKKKQNAEKAPKKPVELAMENLGLDKSGNCVPVDGK